MKKKMFRTIACLLCVLMVMQTLPLSVFASEYRAEKGARKGPEPPATTVSAQEEEAETAPQILYELEEKRSRDTKYYLMSDRSVLAAKYDKPVHYQTEEGWKNINLLAVETSDELEMAENGFQTKFSKKSNGKKLVSVTDENYGLSWGLKDAEKVSAIYQNEDVAGPLEPTALKNLTGTVSYPKILSDTDLEYVVSGDSVKENIILHSIASPTSFSFAYETKHLVPRLSETGAVELYDEENGEVKFTLEKPFMYDSACASSDAVGMELRDVKNGSFTLVLTPDREWLEEKERAWPVVIDPAVYETQYAANIWDVTLSNGSYGVNNEKPELLVGSNGSGEVYRTLIRFPDLPNIDEGVVVKATLRLTAYQGAYFSSDPAQRPRPTDPVEVFAHRITASWPQQTPTWSANSGTYDSEVEDYFIYDETSSEFQLDLTHLVSDWYEGISPNYGVMLKSSYEGARGQIMQFTSSDWSNDSSEYRVNRPALIVQYRNAVGLEDYWAYSTQSVQGGTGHVNLYNGNLTFIHTDATYESLRTGFSLSHVYNSAYHLDNAYETESYLYGKGWSLNLIQSLEAVTVENNSSVKFVYRDGDGTKHYLVEVEEGGQIVDEDGLGYTYSHDTSSDFPHVLTTRDNTKLKFDSFGLLRETEDANGNKINIHYDGSDSDWVITSVTTSSGGEMTFYEGGGNTNDKKLYQIGDNADRRTTYTYTRKADGTQLLTGVTDPDGLQTSYYYNSNNRLTEVYGHDGISLLYVYDSFGRVNYVAKLDPEWQTRQWLEISYSYCQTVVTDHHGKSVTYQFDTLGRPTGIYDEYGNSLYQSFTDNELSKDKIFSNNKVKLLANPIQYVNNSVRNGAFLRGLTEWTFEADSPYHTHSLETVNAPISNQAVKISNYYNEDSGLITQSDLAVSGNTHTLSAYLKTQGVEGENGSGAGAFISVRRANGSIRTVWSDCLTGTTDATQENGYVRVSVTVHLEEGESIQKVGAGLNSALGAVFVNGLQLEEGETANHVNLIEDGGFDYGNVGSPPDYYICYTYNDAAFRAEEQPGYNGGTCVEIYSEGTSENQAVGQHTGLSGKAGDTYSFGAWAKANCVPSHETDNTAGFKMVMQIIPADGGEAQWENIFFNESIDSWQFGTKTVICRKDYSNIYIFLCYYKNLDVAYFDSAFLYRDTAQSFTYDEKGNVVSTRDYASQQNEFAYQDNELSKILTPTGSGFEYAYDEKGNLIASQSTEGIVNRMGYDSYGNVISSTTYHQKETAALQPGKTYYLQSKANGQYLASDPSCDPGTALGTAAFTGSNAQRWTLTKNAKGGFVLSPVESDLVLYAGVPYYEEGEQEALIFEDVNYTPIVLNFTLQEDSSYRIEVADKEGKVFTLGSDYATNGISFGLPSDSLKSAQSWYLLEESSAPTSSVQDGVYSLRLRHSGSYLGLAEGNLDPGILVQQRVFDGSGEQQFEIREYEDSGYYTISPLCMLGQYVNASGNSVSVEEGEIGDEALFSFVYSTASKGWQILSKSNPNLALGVVGASLADEADLVLSQKGNLLHQSFVLEPISLRITSRASYQNNGNFLSTVTDSRGNIQRYTYNTETGTLTQTTDPEGNITSYTYNQNNDLLTSVTQGNATVTYEYSTPSEDYEYYTNNLIGITTPSGTEYHLYYDEYSVQISVYVGNTRLSYDEYNYAHDRLEKTLYGNGEEVSFTYDELDRITEKKYNGVVKVRYTYDKSGNLARVEDLFTNLTTTYRYDLSGRLLETKQSDGYSLAYLYDSYNRLTATVETDPEGTQTRRDICYGDPETGEGEYVSQVLRGGIAEIEYSYDPLLRRTHRYLNLGEYYETEYTYLQGQYVGNTTTLVESLRNGDDLLEYTYDSKGNITQVKKNGSTLESYTYDSLNQLTSVTRGSDTWTYTYDNGGNLLSVKKNGVTEKSYTYGNANWKDQLTAFNGQSITYDAIGNPLTYRGGMTFTWQNGRRLATVTQGTNAYSYLYNADGLRAAKTVNGVTTQFHWLDGVLLGQTTGNNTIRFFYDEAGSAYGFSMGGEDYYYVFNLQGDVIGILDFTGTQVVAYDYDAWGNLLSITGSLATTVGQMNPIRYRGYYYDAETGLYYVSSRYYDPEIGRWINADNRISGVGGDVLGYNMFAYCMNNPVNMSDPSGGWPKWLETAVKVASVVVAVTAVVVMVATVSAVSAGTAAPGALLGATVFLGAALSGINGGVANEAKGNSYINGYLGGLTGGAIQAVCSKTPAGTIVGGGAGVTVGTAVTDVMNNLDPDSANSTAKEIASNAITSGGKALVTSSLTAYMGYASDLAAINGANGLMPTYTRGFGEAVKAFFGWLDDALVYIWE